MELIKGLNSKKKPLATEAAQGHPLIFTLQYYTASGSWSTLNSNTSKISQSSAAIRRSIVSRVKLVLLLNKDDMFVGLVSIRLPKSLIDAIPFSSIISRIWNFLSRIIIPPLSFRLRLLHKIITLALPYVVIVKYTIHRIAQQMVIKKE